MTATAAEQPASRGLFPAAGESVSVASSAPSDLRALVDASPVAIIELDGAGLVREWNAAASRLLAWPADEVLGQPLPAKMLGRQLDVAGLLAGFDGGVTPPVLQLRCRRRDGRMVDVEFNAAATRDTHGRVRGLMALLIDITERKRLERKLRHQAQHDPLTGLPNRELLSTRLVETLVTARSGAMKTGLLLIDLDKFKEVNDTLGHACGDQLLAQIGPRLLAAALREHDTVARLSGDEFAVLLPDLAGVGAAVAVAERVLTALHAPFPVGDTTADVSASIGIAVAPEHGTNPTDLLRHADTAMYEAKDAAAGVAVYEPHRGERAPTRFGLLGELRRALDHNELILHYQPKVDVSTGALVGVEALVRWQHPKRGLLLPAEFIPVAETTGLIHRLTNRVLDIALAQARAWTQTALTVPVAVNLSARCLHDAGLPTRVVAALARYGLPASMLCLEITESSIMRDPAGALVVLRALAAAGIRLSLDDFGTGYSSMTYLRQLPVTELKVDRSFVSDLAAENADAVLVRSAVDLGHNLGLSVVAEGVEDAPTLSALQDLGCDVAQGFYVARPMPADQFGAWLTARGTAHHDAAANPLSSARFPAR
jgi:diguanylate cyclase (GGDEF)-like protein/PAS domain S-box-containing protein